MCPVTSIFTVLFFMEQFICSSGSLVMWHKTGHNILLDITYYHILMMSYYILINDTYLLNCLFSGHLIHKTNALWFSDSVSLSFKTRLTVVTCFCSNVTLINFKHGTRDGKHDDIMSRNGT